MMFHVNHMKHQALFSSKDKIKKKIIVSSAAILLWALKVKAKIQKIYLGQVRRRKPPF